MKRALVSLVLIALLCQLFSGCAKGPSWQPEVYVPAKANKSLKGKTVIVSNFLQAESQVSVTHSIDIQTILESASVQDISLIMAEKLSTTGVPADARVDVKPDQLSSDEILLRGAMVFSPLGGGVNTRHLALGIVSLTVFGLLLPSPFLYYTGADITYRVELIDSQGNILLQTGDRYTRGTYRSRWTFGASQEGSRRKIVALMPEELIDTIKELFR